MSGVLLNLPQTTRERGRDPVTPQSWIKSDPTSKAFIRFNKKKKKPTQTQRRWFDLTWIIN